MNSKIEKQQAEDRRDTGMQRAEDHANAVEENWSEAADAHLSDFCQIMRESNSRFIAEEARAFAEGRGFTSPTDERAWGAVIRRAAIKGTIRKVGYAPAKSSNLSPKCQWEAV